MTRFYGTLGPAMPEVVDTPFFRGQITPYHGLLADVPPDWHLCDGTNGTPDLRGCFLRCIVNDGEQGQTGGSDSISLNLDVTLQHAGSAVANHPIQSHAGSAVADHAAQGHAGSAVGDHAAQAHSGGAVNAHGGLQKYGTTGTAIVFSSPVTHTVTQPTQHPILTHSVTQPSQHPILSHGVTQPSDHAALNHAVTQPDDHHIDTDLTGSIIPAFYKLAYIMKL